MLVETQRFWLRVRPEAQAVQYEAVREHWEQGNWQALQDEEEASKNCPEGHLWALAWQTPFWRTVPAGQESTQASLVVYWVGQVL